MNKNIVSGNIKINSNTKNHESNLRKLGYDVTPGDGAITVHGTGFVAHLDLSTSDQLKQVIQSKQLLTYGTKVTFPDGKTLSSVPACLKLGGFSKSVGLPNLSCLVVKPGSAESKGSSKTVQPTGEWAQFMNNLSRPEPEPVEETEISSDDEI